MEVFKNIEGYEGLYAISNEGRVKSLARDVEWRGTIRHQPERILKPIANNRGYLHVFLCKDGKVKTYYLHRLVASAFIENPDGLPQVNHKDECPTNNCVFVNEDGSVNYEKSNLEWCTNEYNCNYGTHNQRMAETLTNGKRSIPVDMLTKDGELIRTFPSSAEAMRWLRINGYPKASHSHVNECCKGRLQSCYGFKWRYANGN